MHKEHFIEGLKYPWKKPKQLLNILWILIPIVGFLAILGYLKKIVIELSKGKKEGLPKFGKFVDNLSVGFMLFIYLIPTFIVLFIIQSTPFIGPILYLLVVLLALPWLVINLFVKGEFKALWELKEVYEVVTKRFTEYLIALLKTFVFGIIYGLASIILIGIPCYMFGGYYYLIDFYRKK